MSDWGQGAKNNNIGWGQGAVNNDISWGSVHENSWSGDTDIVGLDPIEPIINAFTSRVASDNGVFEAESCLNTTLTDLNDDGLLDDASLIITPNAVEEGKLFSIKPTDGSGDLSVVRATSATRVDAQGLVEIPRTNLVLRSEEFNDAYWTKSNATVISNSIISPSGIQNADKLIEGNDLANKRLFISPNLSVGTNYTYSVYAKKGERDFCYINAYSNASNLTWFNLNTGTIGTSQSGIASITDLGNGWYRCTITISALSGTQFFLIGISNADNITNYLGDGVSGIYIWGAQLEQGVSATEYIPTTSVIRTKFAGITQDGGSASNIPRLDYTNGSCPSILVEPQRTNLALYSQSFIPSWSTSPQTTALVLPTTTIDPQGLKNAVSIKRVVGNQFGITFSVSTGVPYANSIYVRRVSGTGNVELVGVNGSSINIGSDITSEWKRFSISETATSTVGRFYVRVINIGDVIEVWGAQLEAGSNATSYIPTVASAVTRNADVISKTGISSLIGQTEGTIFVDFELQPNNINGNFLFSLSDGTSSNLIRSEIFILSPTVSQFRTGLNTAGVTQGDNFTTITQLRNKMAISYSLNNFKLFINGVLLYTDTTANIPATTGFYLGNRAASGNFIGANYKQAILWKTQLTNTECINLTTL
jgi:hypothetical protein